ncbi:MAG TPA: hypothetical protein VI750_09395 [Pyrinomonadaceae bacterium]|nr:hypothetical protein [Pyrinomonadaceae bacterium]
MNGGFMLPVEVARIQRPALIAGGVALLAFLLSALVNRPQFFRFYLIAYVFWVGIALGSLALLLLQHLTGGQWGLVIRRVLESSTRTLPLMLLLFVPIVVGSRYIYPWMDQGLMASKPALAEKASYLNLWFFVVRTVVYFAVWLGTAYLLNAWSLEQDRTTDRSVTRRMRMFSGPGLIFFVLTVTFASIDWAMSLNPEWYSTIYGLIYVAAWTLSALAFTTAVMSLLIKHEPMAGIVRPSHFQDLGKLLLALVMLWAYFAFSQFLIVWSGNLPEEIHWYLPRVKGFWGAIALLVVIFHFGFPFLLLLSRRVKRDPRMLVFVALTVLMMRLLDLFWMILPEFTHDTHMSWMDALTAIIAQIGFGGIWLAAFLWQLGKRPLIPVNDPQFEALVSQADTRH